MLDVELIRTSPEAVRDSLRRRSRDDLLEGFERLLRIDAEWRTLVTKIRDLRAEKNKASAAIAKAPKEEKQRAIQEATAVSTRIADGEAELARLAEGRDSLLALLPNIPHPEAPVGPTEASNRTILEWGDKREFGFAPRDHIDIGLALGLMDVERAAKVSGARFYYLKGDLVLLELALMRFAMDVLRGEGFLPISTPAIARERAFFGTGFLPSGRDDLYRVEKPKEEQSDDRDQLFLVGTAEVALGAMHMDEMLREEELPLRYAGFSPCFRTEAGAHGRDTKGIFRVHQFYKVEMFVFSHPEKSWEEHERMAGIAQRVYRELGIPHRVVDIATGELGPSAARKYDIEAWLPGQGKYREVVSASNCTDYQSRRLGARFVDRKDQKVKPVHTLNATTIASARTIVAIMENQQREDGSIGIPEPLVPYMGADEIVARSPQIAPQVRTPR